MSAVVELADRDLALRVAGYAHSAADLRMLLEAIGLIGEGDGPVVRWCSRCAAFKPIDAFPPDSTVRGGNGRRYGCKACKNKRAAT